MKLQRIVIEDYKQFLGRVVIDDLLPGLNVFTGPNEVGKTTLVDALRKVFLERHKASTLNDIVPWSKPDARPRVEVKYEIGGIDHLLIKHFVSRPRCELRIGDKRLEGDEAEEFLARTLGFERAGKGTARPELGGIPGLLWVQQGSSQDVQESAQYAAQYLRDALGELAGGTIAQGDDVLIHAVSAEMTELVTEKTRKPVGAYAAVEKELFETRQSLDQLELQERAFNADIERLTRLQTEFDSEVQNKPWEELERRAAEAVTQVQALSDAEALVGRTTKDMTDAERRAKLLNDQQRAALEDEQAVVQLTQQVSVLQGQAADARADERRAREALTQLESALHDATAEQERAEAAAAFVELRKQLQAAGAAETQVRQTVAEAELVANSIRDLSLEAARLQIDPTGLKRLQQVDGELLLLRAKRDATLTKVEYRLETGRTAVLGDSTLTGHGVASIDVPTTLSIPHFGELTISPGVSDLAELHSKAASLEGEFARVLQTLGVATLREGQDRFHKLNDVTAELATKKALLSVHAPKGLDALKTSLTEAEARREVLRNRMPEEAPADANRTLPDAKAAVGLARSQLESVRKQEGSAIEKRAKVEGQLQQTEQALKARQGLIQSTEYQAKRTSIRDELVNTNAEVESFRDKRTAANDRVKELQALVDAGAAEQLRKSAQHVRDGHQEKGKTLIRLRTQLEGIGAAGLGEQIAHSRAHIEQQERRHHELAKRAAALQLLHGLLVEERDKLVQQLRTPLTQRIEEYLRLLLPQSRLTVADNLTPWYLLREEGQGEFQSLSFGTQEQLGVVVRLAYADLLQDAGRPTLLIFDDAVTHSDSVRLGHVKRVLLHAAGRHQVFVLSCHPEDWNDVGVPLRAMDDLKTSLVSQ